MTTITTGASGPQAWKIALVAGAVGLATLVAVNLPQTTSDTTGEQVAATATATLPESVTGFEYENESTPGHVATPGVTSQYTGNSDELFPYENGLAPQRVPSQEIDSLIPVITQGSVDVLVSPGVNQNRQAPGTIPSQEIDSLAPVITQEFLDGPSSAPQGATRVDPRAAAAAGLNPGAIDAVVGGTTRVAPLPDNLADAQVRAEVAQIVPAPSFAASDEALVNPVPEVNAAQLIQDQIAAEIAARAPADPLIDQRVNGDPYLGGTSDDALTRRSTGVDPADIKYLEASPKPA